MPSGIRNRFLMSALAMNTPDRAFLSYTFFFCFPFFFSLVSRQQRASCCIKVQVKFGAVDAFHLVHPYLRRETRCKRISRHSVGVGVFCVVLLAFICLHIYFWWCQPDVIIFGNRTDLSAGPAGIYISLQAWERARFVQSDDWGVLIWIILTAAW